MGCTFIEYNKILKYRNNVHPSQNIVHSEVTSIYRDVVMWLTVLLQCEQGLSSIDNFLTVVCVNPKFLFII